MPTRFKFLLIGIAIVLAGCYFFISGTADILGRVLLSMGIFIEVGAVFYAIAPKKWLSK
ncbi:hypothetical protein [Runella sp. SP2]|uniref:hypothetical protein n=1 Tax=Runella sp. SP2 TaxID=2268026 RepID=UPI0013DE6212|nr:hypothetical protein [Runella sp. SP2]